VAIQHPKQTLDKRIEVNDKMTDLKETKISRRARKLCPTIITGEGLTEQSHKDQCDINQILADYTRTGFMRHAKENKGRYDDVSAVDFQKSMETVANVKSLFENLPSEIRKEFGQNPSNFLNYVQDPSNGSELAARGILAGNDGLDITGAYTPTMTKQQYAQSIQQKSASAAEVSSAPDADSTSVSASEN